MEKKYLNIDNFKILYYLFSIFFILPPTMSFCSKFSKIFLIIGLFILLINIYKEKKRFIKTTNYLLFCQIFILISVFVNYENNFKTNLIFFCYGIIQTLLMLISPKNQNENGIVKEKYITIVIITTCLLSFIFSFISILIFLFDFKNTFTFNTIVCVFGVYENRLFGVFANPNVGSFVSWFSIVLSIYFLLFINKKGVLLKIFMVTNILLQYIVLGLGNSRSVDIMLVILAFGISYIFFRKKIKNRYINIVLVIFISLSCYSAKYLANTVSFKFYGIFKEPVVEEIVIDQTISDKPVNKDNSNSSNIERDYKDQDISNGRLSIWKNGLKIVLENPKNFLFGVGNENIKENSIRISGVENDIFSNMHNIYLQIFVGSGIVALICFLLYFISLFKKHLTVIRIGSSKNMDKLTYLGTVVVAFLISGLFDSSLLYLFNLFITMSFWLSVYFYTTLINNELEYSNEKKDIIFD